MKTQPGSDSKKLLIVWALNTLNTASNVGNRIFLALLAVKLGASPLMVGVIAAMFAVFPLLMAVKAGRLHDSLGSRRLLLPATGLMGLSLLIPAFWSAVSAIVIAALLCGLASVIFNVCTQNLTGLLSTSETRARNFSNYSLSNSIAHFIAPLIAGFTADHMSNESACMMLAAFGALPLLVFAGYRRPLEPLHAASRANKVKPEKSDEETAGSALAMLKNPMVRTTLFTGSILNAALVLFQFYMPVYAYSVGISASVMGVVMAMYSIAAFLIRLFLPNIIRRLRENGVLFLAFSLGACAVAFMPLFQNPWVLGGLTFLFGIGMGMGHPVVLMQMFSHSPKGRSGEGVGLRMTVSALTKMASPVIFGAVAGAAGISAIFWLYALMLAGGSYLSRPKHAETGAPT